MSNIVLSQELSKFILFFAQYTLTPLGLAVNLILRYFSETQPQEEVVLYKLIKQKQKKQTAKRQIILDSFAKKELLVKEEIKGSVSILASLIKEGYIEKIITPLAKLSYNPIIAKLNDEQKIGSDIILDAKKQETFLLHGVTGSGKTEVYFTAVDNCLKQGGQVLILVPEVALTSQLMNRFKNRFNIEPKSWHSNLSKKSKHKIWYGCLKGDIKIIVGARSALFLPFYNLQLIVVDEEHDSSFKQEENIFYNARDMAVARARFCRIPIILCSATPSIESIYNAEKGKYKYIKIKNRYNCNKLPTIKLVEFIAKDCFISEPLYEAVKQNLVKQQQTILYVGRRGYASLVVCKECNYRVICPNCSSHMVMHQAKQILLCHYCNYHISTLDNCENCNNVANWKYIGFGVERLAEEVKTLFPEARCLILSTDFAANIKALQHQLALIENGEVDIIIGTQLVSKGHNFPKVNLVGVINADISLNSSDFRAAERTYQIIKQVTGRAGRDGQDSIAIIQSQNIKHPVIKTFLSQDSEEFYKQELSMRHRSDMPPVNSLASIIISCNDEKQTQLYAKYIRSKMPDLRDMDIFGPAPAVMSKIKNQYRYKIFIKTKKEFNIQKYLRNLLNNLEKKNSSILVQIDIDPQSFL